MRWKPRDPFVWRRYFALLPKRIGNEIIWLERFEGRASREAFIGTVGGFPLSYVERRLIGSDKADKTLVIFGWC